MLTYNSFYIILFLVFLGNTTLTAQKAKEIHVGLGLTANTYVGDLSEESLSLQRFLPGGHISLRFDKGKRLWPQLNIGIGRIIEQLDAGDLLPASSDISPNTFVETSIFNTEFQLNARLLKKGIIQPYVAAGLGIVFYSPKDQEGNALGDNPFTRELDEIYGTAGFYLPLTAGFLITLGQKLSIGTSYTFRPTTTDYLDNIGLLGVRNGNDKLHSLQISLYYNLKKQSKDSHIPPQTLPNLKPLIAQNKPVAEEEERHQIEKMERNWIAWEETALLLRKFVYYTVQPNDEFQELCQRFHLRPEVVRRINFMSNDHLETGMILRLPDVGQNIGSNSR